MLAIMLKEVVPFKTISAAFLFLLQNIFQLQQNDTTPGYFCLLCAICISFISYIILLSTRSFF